MTRTGAYGTIERFNEYTTSGWIYGENSGEQKNTSGGGTCTAAKRTNDRRSGEIVRAAGHEDAQDRDGLIEYRTT